MLKIICTIALYVASIGAQAALPSSISFDGYCDGITGLADQRDGTYLATHNYTMCDENGYTYTNDLMVGPSGRRLMELPAVAGVVLVESSYPQFGYTHTYVINADNTWYEMSPESGGLDNLGTWTAGYPAQQPRDVRSLKPSFMK